MSQCSDGNVGNEQYLIVSYFVVGAGCLGLAIATYALLRRSFRTLSDTAPGGRLGRIMRSLFLVGIMLPSLFGFFSITFHSCKKDKYEAIVEDRSYLVAKNQEQIGAALSYVTVALLFWGGIVAVGFLISDKQKK